MSTPRVVLTVSGVIPTDIDEQIAAGKRPKADYLEIARRCRADLLDHHAAAADLGRWATLIGRLGGANAVLAVALWKRRKHYDVVLTDGEQVGLPYALLTRWRRRPRHVMIVHIMSVAKKVRMFRWGGARRGIDTMLVYATSQRDVAIEQLGMRPEQVVLTTFMTDTDFFRPHIGAPADSRPVICSAGLEFRDYPTMIDAVRDLDAEVVLAAASPWSKRASSADQADIPSHVTVQRFDLFGLRELYARADLVVVPVVETDFQAGITTILEAMAMGKAVVCTRTTGQTDTIVDDVTGVYVPPGDVPALRAAIEGLLADPARRARLGAAAREWVTAHADIQVYAQRLADIATETTADSASEDSAS